MKQADYLFVLDTQGAEKVVLDLSRETATPSSLQISVRTPAAELNHGIGALYDALLTGLGDDVGPTAELTPNQARELAAALNRFADGQPLS